MAPAYVCYKRAVSQVVLSPRNPRLLNSVGEYSWSGEADDGHVIVPDLVYVLRMYDHSLNGMDGATFTTSE